MRLDNKVILEKLQAYFSDPVGFPDLPDYIVALWKVTRDKEFKTAEELVEEEEMPPQGVIFNTHNLDDLRALYFLLRNPEIRDLQLYQITPQGIIFLMEYLEVKV